MTKEFPKRNLTTGDIAKLCGVNFRTVIRWIQRGHLKAFQLPGRGDNRVQLQDFLAFLRENNMPIPEELQPKGRRVLVVDDDDKTAASLTKALTKGGFSVERAADGFEAGALASSFEPTVIVVDPRGAGMGGNKLIEALRANPATAAISVVVVSAMPQAELEASVESGADAAFHKPAKPSDVLNKVEELVGDANPFLG